MTTAGQVTRSVEKFNDYGNNLANSSYSTFDNNLEIFLDFCENDAVFSAIHSQLLSVPDVDFQSWYEAALKTGGSFVGSCDLKFPSKADKRIALQYEILRRFARKAPEATDFASKFFPAARGASVDQWYRELGNAVTRPFIKEVNYRLQDILDAIPKESRESVAPNVIQIFNQPNTVIAQSVVGNNNTQTASIVTGELDQKFAELEQELRAHIKDPVILADNLEIVETARDHARASSPSKRVMNLLFKGLPHVGNVLSIGASIVGMMAG